MDSSRVISQTIGTIEKNQVQKCFNIVTMRRDNDHILKVFFRYRRRKRLSDKLKFLKSHFSHFGVNKTCRINKRRVSLHTGFTASVNCVHVSNSQQKLVLFDRGASLLIFSVLHDHHIAFSSSYKCFDSNEFCTQMISGLLPKSNGLLPAIPHRALKET